MTGRVATVSVMLAAALATPLAAEDRALLVGINDYADQRIRDLRGCEDDVQAVRLMLTQTFGFREVQIKVLLSRAATRRAIVDAFNDWLIAGTKPGDRVVFFVSSHGSQMKDASGDETDGRDEVLCPADYNAETQANAIVDDEIAVWLGRLDGRNVTVIVDACHSGSISKDIGGTLYGVETIETLNGVPKYIDPPGKDVFWTPGGAVAEATPADVGKPAQGGGALGATPVGGGGGIVDEAGANYVLFTACADFQRAEEILVPVGGVQKRRGAFTWMLARGAAGPADADSDGSITNAELLRYAEQALRDPAYDLSQKPELRTRGVLQDAPVFGKTFAVIGPGQVVAVNGEQVTINRGAQHEVKKGDRFLATSGADKGAESTGTIEIADAEQFLASGRIVGGSVKRGQFVRPASVTMAQGPLRVHLARFDVPGEVRGRLVSAIREELPRIESIALTESSDSADRFVTATMAGGRVTTCVSSRYGTLRSRAEHDDVHAAAASLARRLRAEALLARLATAENRNADFRVDLSVAGGRDTFVIRRDPDRAEKIEFRVRASRSCYLTLLNITSEGEVRLLLPNRWQKSPLIEGGKEYTVPPRDQDAYEFVVESPPGRDFVKAVVTGQPLALSGVNARSLGEPGYVNLGDGADVLEELLQGVVASGDKGFHPRERRKTENDPEAWLDLPTEGWATAQIVVTTIPE